MERAAVGEPVALTAPGLFEMSYGLAKAASATGSANVGLAWLARLSASDLVMTLPLDEVAALVAGRVRAAQPVPPTGARRSGTKPDQRTAWILDIQIASCAWAHGHALATDNRRDFAAIAELIAGLYPAAGRLEVIDPPPV
ncbi:MAG: hypothetical protein QOJ25_521 [Solirubrobacteraceae bacterium]|nr:hypothetical protein [Solirubrobacteraceae bacterium]